MFRTTNFPGAWAGPCRRFWRRRRQQHHQPLRLRQQQLQEQILRQNRSVPVQSAPGETEGEGLPRDLADLPLQPGKELLPDCQRDSLDRRTDLSC